jgi:pilus assembly protein CpaE
MSALENTHRALRVIAIPVGDGARRALEESLAGGMGSLDIGLVDAGPSRAAEIVTREAMDAALIASDGDAETAVSTVERLLRARPDLAVVVLAHNPTDSFVDRVFAAGAEDVLFAPESPARVELAIQKACARLSRTRTVAATPVALGRIVAVVGPKGGSGKTMTSTNLGCSLARAGKRTLLIDLDLEFGDCAIVLGLAPERTVFDLMIAPGMLDEEKLRGYVTRHEPSGLDVLIAPARPDQAEAVTADRIEQLFNVARHLYDFIVVDSAPAFSPGVIATVDAADEVVILASMDVPSLKDARLGLDTLELMGRRRDDVRVVVNRANSKAGLSMSRVSEALNRDVDIAVPSDAGVPSSYNDGVPVVLASPKGPVAKAVSELRDALIGASGSAGQSNVHRRLFGLRRS